MEFKAIRAEFPEDSNMIVGQAHFIKTVEDLYEAVVTAAPSARFAVALCEASGDCLVRVEGNDASLKKCASDNALRIGAGHVFIIVLKDAYPLSVLNAVKNCPEVCRVFCATANPLEVLTARTEQGVSVVGVVDGFSPRGVEGAADADKRKELLRKLGYKL